MVVWVSETLLFCESPGEYWDGRGEMGAKMNRGLRSNEWGLRNKFNGLLPAHKWDGPAFEENVCMNFTLM